MVAVWLFLGVVSCGYTTQSRVLGFQSVCEEVENSYPCANHSAFAAMLDWRHSFGGNYVRSSDAACRLEYRLRWQLAGQPHAISKIPAALRVATQRTRAMTLFFGGDNGVGKTSAALMIAEEVFQYRNDDQNLPDGFLRVDSGVHLTAGDTIATPAQIQASIKFVQDQVIAQLKKCPHSVILFDELNSVHVDVIRSLTRFTDKQYIFDDKGDKVSLVDAILIFVSDFGRAAVTKHMSDDQILREIKETVAWWWFNTDKNESPAAKAAAMDQVVKMIDFIVPFLPLQRDALQEVARTLFEEYPRRAPIQHANIADVIVQQRVRELVVNNITGLVQEKFGRAVNEIVRNDVTMPLMKHVPRVQPQKKSLLPFWQTSESYYVYVHAVEGKPGVAIQHWTDKLAFCVATANTRARLVDEHRTRRAAIVQAMKGLPPEEEKRDENRHVDL